MVLPLSGISLILRELMNPIPLFPFILWTFNKSPAVNFIMKHLVIIVLLACICSACQTTSRIAYLTNRSGNFDIYLTDEKGEDHTALTNNPGWDWSPQWNEHLNGIIYNSNDTLENFSIRLMTASGKSMPLDTDGLEEFILSPDGELVLYTESDSANRYINLLDLRSGARKPLVTIAAYNGRTKWAPNSRVFSFISDRDGNNEIYLYDMATGIQKRLTNTPSREKYTSWTPDNRSIVFTASEEGVEYNDIYRVDIRTGAISRITEDSKMYEEICVSPDGKKIAFHGRIDGKHHILTINMDGTGQKQITQVEAYHGEPEWIPGRR